jgi:hypothetical protein
VIQLASASNLLAAVANALAAYHWYQAAQVKNPPAVLVGSGGGWVSQAKPFEPNAGVDASPLVEYARESSKRNKTAATWSAAAAAFAALGWVLGLFVPHA